MVRPSFRLMPCKSRGAKRLPPSHQEMACYGTSRQMTVPSDTMGPVRLGHGRIPPMSTWHTPWTWLASSPGGRNKGLINALLGEQGDPAFVVRLKDSLKPLWRRYVVSHDVKRPEEEIDLLLEYTLAGTVYMISRWLRNPGKVNVFQLAHLVYDFSIQDLKQRTDA